jgi:hypothetical protein
MLMATTTTKKPAPGYALRLPATKQAQRFIERLRDFANYGAIERIRVKYSGPRPHYAYDTKRADATALRVYIDLKSERKACNEMWARKAEADRFARLCHEKDNEIASLIELAARLRAEEESARVNLNGTMRDLEGERAVNRLLNDHILAHAENVRRHSARIQQCPRWLWAVIDYVRTVLA